MTKLDWSKAGQATSDPARASKTDAEFRTFPPTPSGRKEFETAKKVRSVSAKRAAQTRKMNKERDEERRRLAELDAVGKEERDAAFFAKVQSNLTADGRSRKAKSHQQKPSTGSLGAILQEALNAKSKT